MGIRKYEPTTPGRHGASVSDLIELTRSTPEKSLLISKPKTGGRSNSGRITTHHIGGSHKQAYHVINFKRYGKDGVPTKAAHIEYDPSRTARIALLHYRDGEKRYIIASSGPTQGTVVVSDPGSDIKPGNSLEPRRVPVGTMVHAVELRPGGGAKLGRSTGAATRLVAREGKYTTLRMPSGEIRMVSVRCRTTISAIDNTEQSNINWNRVGRNRQKGIRLTVRGVMMDPVGHLHGDGKGHTSGDRRPVSPWGKPEDRTRDKNKASSRFIARRRETGKKR